MWLRRDFGKWLIEESREMGIKVRPSYRVVKLNKKGNWIELENGERIGYNYLIGADGSTSIIRRKLGFNTKQIVQCIEYPVKGDFEDLEIHFDLKKYGATYCWIFPHRGYVSIGTGTFSSLVPAQEMSQRFNRWAGENGIDLTKVKKKSASHILWLSWL